MLHFWAHDNNVNWHFKILEFLGDLYLCLKCLVMDVWCVSKYFITCSIKAYLLSTKEIRLPPCRIIWILKQRMFQPHWEVYQNGFRCQLEAVTDRIKTRKQGNLSSEKELSLASDLRCMSVCGRSSLLKASSPITNILFLFISDIYKYLPAKWLSQMCLK